MPNTVGNLSLLEPVGGDPVSELRTAITTNAAALGDAIVWSYAAAPLSVTATIGQCLLAAPGVTVTLPSPTENAMVRVIANAAVTYTSPVEVASGSADIFGVGISTSGASSFLIGVPCAAVTLFGTGTAWQIVAGQPSPGGAVTQPSRTINTSYQPNIAASTFVSGYGTTSTNKLELLIGATSTPSLVAASFTANTGPIALTAVVPAGWYYEFNSEGGTITGFTVTETSL